MAKIQNTSNSGEDVEQELPYISARNAKWCSHFGKQFNRFLTKLNKTLLYDPAAILFGIYSKKLKIHFNTVTLT